MNTLPWSSRAPTKTVTSLSIGSMLKVWHLCSLDAPTVAACWTVFVAHAAACNIPWTSPASMFLAVWMLYAGDRLLDVRAIGQQQNFEERHFFHARHRKGFGFALVVCSSLLALLLFKLTHEELHLFAALGSLLFGYFFAIHIWPLGNAASASDRLPKEFAVGFFFSAAVFIPTVSRSPDLRLSLLPSALIFGVVCALNCLYVYTWEHTKLPADVHWATRFVTSRVGASACFVFALCCGGMRAAQHDPILLPCALSCGISVLSFLLLHRMRRHFTPVTLRAAVDFVLVLPLPFVALIVMHTR